jgi:hypothetical protein
MESQLCRRTDNETASISAVTVSMEDRLGFTLAEIEGFFPVIPARRKLCIISPPNDIPQPAHTSIHHGGIRRRQRSY